MKPAPRRRDSKGEDVQLWPMTQQYSFIVAQDAKKETCGIVFQDFRCPCLQECLKHRDERNII